MIARYRSRVHGSEEGFSLPELLVVTLIMGIVAVVLMGVLTTVTQASARTEAKSRALAEARTALEVIARDLRAANPIDPLASAAAHRTEVKFSVYCSAVGVNGCTSANLTSVTYKVSGNQLTRTQNGVTRVLLGPSGPASLPAGQQRNAIINDPLTQPVFRYYKANGTELSTATSPALVENFRDCTKIVRIRLAVVQEPQQVDRKIDLSTDINLRNFNEVTGC